MDFALDGEQRLLREEIVGFARAELGAGAVERDRDERFPRDLWLRCGTLRLQGLPVPEEYGGRGLDPLSTVIALDALGYGCEDGGLSFAICAHLLACVVPIWKHGSPELKRRYLPGLSDGTLIAGNGMTEAGSGSDAFAMATRAVPDGAGFRLTGSKNFVSNGPVADLIVAYAETDPGKGFAGGITAFVVPSDADGVRLGQTFEKMGLRSASLGEVLFEDAWVPRENVLGGVGGGGSIFAESMDWERACLGGIHVGTMERLLERVIRRVRQTKTRGEAVGQGSAHRIVEMKVRLEAARLMAYRAAASLGRSREAAMAASMAKLFVSEALVATARSALRLLADEGEEGDDAARALRDAVSSTLYSGTSEIQRNIIARWLGV